MPHFQHANVADLKTMTEERPSSWPKQEPTWLWTQVRLTSKTSTSVEPARRGVKVGGESLMVDPLGQLLAERMITHSSYRLTSVRSEGTRQADQPIDQLRSSPRSGWSVQAGGA